MSTTSCFASSVAVAESLVLSFLAPVHAVAMNDKGPRGNLAFEVWFQLREALSLIRRRRALRFDFDERAAFVVALANVHALVHGPGCGVMHVGEGEVSVVCGCDTLRGVRTLGVLLGGVPCLL